jgi:hypothetical protein
MGVVWLAEDVRLKRFVALEFLSSELAADARGRVDEALAWLERGIEEHDTLVGFLHLYSRGSRRIWRGIRDSRLFSRGLASPMSRA